MPGHARTPGRHQRLGGPLPRQQPNTTTARPTAPELWFAPDARREHRWELPAVSRGYARPWGWLPSPYSPLRHWPDLAAGPVRLACLIHAANVHSEPGSNPSQMSQLPGGIRGCGVRSGGRSPPQRVEENAGRTPPSALVTAPTTLSPDARRASKRASHPPRRPRRTCAGPCEPSRRLLDLGTTQAGRFRIDPRTPASLKGS